MTKGQKAKQRFIKDMFEIYGFEQDRFGHFKVYSSDHDKIYRFKMQKTSCRVEIKRGSRWLKHHTKYYSNLNVKDYDLTLRGCKNV